MINLDEVKIGSMVWHHAQREPLSVVNIARHQATGRVVAIRLSNGHEIDDGRSLEWVPQKRDEVVILTSLYAPYLGDRLSQVDARLQEQWARDKNNRDWNVIKPLQAEQAAIKASLNYFAADAQIDAAGHWTDRVCSVKGIDGGIASVTEIGRADTAKIHRLPLHCLRVLNRFSPDALRANAQRTGLKQGVMVQVDGHVARLTAISGEWGYLHGDSIVGSRRLSELTLYIEEKITA